MSKIERLLSSRARVAPGYYALLPQEGRVENVLPNLKKCRASILASRKLGAGFASYIFKLEAEGGTTLPFGGENEIEMFLYVNEGTLSVEVEGERRSLKKGEYVYVPPGNTLEFQCHSVIGEAFLYKNHFRPLEEKMPWIVWGDTEKLEWSPCDGRDNLLCKNLLPSDITFDIGFHILLFKEGGCHSFVETHLQEHGAFVLQGQGMYLLDTTWTPVEKGDFIWMGSYVPQAAYGIGRGEFSYIFSKDCNRDIVV